jgi:hypothetical protein
MRREEEVSVTLGDGVVVIRRTGSSRAVVANILGIDPSDSPTPSRIWLDRLVHRPGEQSFIGWKVSGAVVTMLEQSLAALEDKAAKRTI